MTRDELLMLSDERDQWERRCAAAWREGYACGAGDRFAEGYAAGVAAVKRAQHHLVHLLTPAGRAWVCAVERHACPPQPASRSKTTP